MGHINQHLEEWLGLRQILDWALYADKALDDAWEHTFAPDVRRLGLDRLAITVTRMCQLYLGRNPFCLVLAALPIPSSSLKA